MRYFLDTHTILLYVDASRELPLALRDLNKGWIAPSSPIKR